MAKEKKFTAEEEKYIEERVNEYKAKVRKAELDEEVQRRINEIK